MSVQGANQGLLHETVCFMRNHKVLCVLSIGLAIPVYMIGNLCGRAVVWIREALGTAEKTHHVGSKSLGQTNKTGPDFYDPREDPTKPFDPASLGKKEDYYDPTDPDDDFFLPEVLDVHDHDDDEVLISRDDIIEEAKRYAENTPELSLEDLLVCHNEIIPNLYLGRANEIENIENIDLVVLATKRQNADSDFLKTVERRGGEVYEIPHPDGDDIGIDEIKNGMQDVLAKIYHAMSNNKRVYVGCQQGKDRSALIVVAFIMWQFQVDAEIAVNFVKSKRPIVTVDTKGDGGVENAPYWNYLVNQFDPSQFDIENRDYDIIDDFDEDFYNFGDRH